MVVVVAIEWGEVGHSGDCSGEGGGVGGSGTAVGLVQQLVKERKERERERESYIWFGFSTVHNTHCPFSVLRNDCGAWIR